MSDFVEDHVKVEFLAGEPGKSGIRFRLSNALGDRLIVDAMGDPRVKEFAFQSVIADNAYFELDWCEREIWAAEETRKCVEKLQHENKPYYGGGDQGIDDQVMLDHACEDFAEKPALLGPNNQGMPDLSRRYLPEQAVRQLTPIEPVGGQRPDLSTNTIAALGATGRFITPIEPVGYQYPDSTPNVAATQGATLGQSTPIEPLGSQYPEPVSAMTATLSPAPTDEMETDQPAASPRATLEPQPRSSSGTPTKSSKGDAKKKDRDPYPFVNKMNPNLTEDDWKFLVAICAKHFLDDLDRVAETGGKPKSRLELMAMTLLDPRVAGADKDYSVTKRQLDGQLYERKLVGRKEDVVKHTREALQAGCFDKPPDRRNRRKKDKTGNPGAMKTEKTA